MPKPLTRTLLTLATGLVLAACSAPNPYYDGSRSHHRPGGFQNNHRDFETKSLAELVRWRLAAYQANRPAPALAPTPRVAPDLEFLRANAAAGSAMQPALTWIGHASVLAQFGGLNLITDPMFSQRASPLSWIGPTRAQPPGVALAELPRIDIVMISHNHYDHLDVASVQALQAQNGGPPLFVVPLGLGPWLMARGITRVVELDWWQAHSVGAVELVLTPVRHWSGRGLTDRMATLWGGFAVFAPDFHLFFAGDTGYSPDFTDIRQRFAARQAEGGGFDIALLPVGAYAPRWFMADQHIDPTQAVQVHRDLGAKRSLGVHWGTFELTDESLDAPVAALAAARAQAGLAEADFFLLAIGQTRRLPRRSP
ncbi:MAG: MBL fold metallo-hydrolase [Rubrivivax sp.]|nr:MBL fold metallo-hydrolase [Rubrivivax sp.]